MKPIRNPKTEQLAEEVAAAIRANNPAAYRMAMERGRDTLDAMVRWELLAFRERVHHLAEKGGEG